MDQYPPLPGTAVGAYREAYVLASEGRLPDAEQRFRAALLEAPDHPAVLAGLGIVIFRQGRHEEGIGFLRRATECTPSDPACHHLLGKLLCALGRTGEGIACFEQAIALQPQFAEAHNDLAIVLSSLDRVDEALEHFRSAIETDASNPTACTNAGILLARSGRYEEAVGYYRKAVARQPRFGEALLNLGVSLNELGRAAEAAVAFNQAVAVDPSSAAAVVGHGMAMQTLGRLEEARADFERAVALEPGNTAYHRVLSDAKTFRDGDPQIAVMEAILKEEQAPGRLINLHFALGKAYDDTHRFAAAFAQFKAANALVRQQLAYDEQAEFDAMAAIAAKFPREFIAAHRGRETSAGPVFVIGMPRSGTSLVEQILASHPQVHGAGELPDFGLIASGGRGARETIANVTDERLGEIGTHYFEKLSRLAPEASRIVDKMPSNFLLAGLIHMALPNARLIHVRRDPLDTCLSCYAHFFRNGFEFSYDLGELGRYYRAYERLMAHWRAVLPPGVMLEIGYESLIADFETEARRLVAFCGLDWNERCLAFHTVRRSVRTASTYQVHRPLYSSSVGRWRNYEPCLGPLVEALRDH